MANLHVGIDPGFNGAVGKIWPSGRVEVEDLPITGTGKEREFDTKALLAMFKRLFILPCEIIVEWPTTRPGEGAERSKRFGHGLGLIEGMLVALGRDFQKVVPNLWKGRLGLPGKDDPEAVRLSAKMFDSFYPEYSHLIRGPRGGLKDGRIDALLIAHYSRHRDVQVVRQTVQRFGKESDQAIMLALGGRRRRRKTKPGPLF